MDPRRILVVDDHREFAVQLGQILTDHGATVSVAYDGAEALALVSSASFDALITDLKMPGVDGMALVREVHRVVPGLAAIVITGAGSELSPADSREVLAVLPKPVPFRRLIDVLERVTPTAH